MNGETTEVSDMPCKVRTRRIRVQDGSERVELVSWCRASISLRAHPKCTLSTSTPSGSSLRAALPAIPPSYRQARVSDGDLDAVWLAN